MKTKILNITQKFQSQMNIYTSLWEISSSWFSFFYSVPPATNMPLPGATSFRGPHYLHCSICLQVDSFLYHACFHISMTYFSLFHILKKHSYSSKYYLITLNDSNVKSNSCICNPLLVVANPWISSYKSNKCSA